MSTVRLPNLTHVLESKGTSRAVDFQASSLRITRPLSRFPATRYTEKLWWGYTSQGAGRLREAAQERATRAGAGGFEPPTSRLTAGRAASFPTPHSSQGTPRKPKP